MTGYNEGNSCQETGAERRPGRKGLLRESGNKTELRTNHCDRQEKIIEPKLPKHVYARVEPI
jgi:hypothetical protein